MTKISAHAGFNSTEPNSLDSLRQAIQLNLELIELDIIMHNGVPVLSHNKPLKQENPPTFCDALNLLKDSNITINCDAKEEDVIPHALEQIKKYGFENRYFFTGSCNLDSSDYKFFINIENIEQISGYIQIDENYANKLIEVYSGCNNHNLLGFNINHKCLTDDAIKILIDSKISIICWTIDDEADLKKYLHKDFYAITTNNVSLAQNILINSNTN